MSLRSAINAYCRDCICDPMDAGLAAQQIACCVSNDCPLHPVRPITATVISRALVRVEALTPESGQTGHILSTELISRGGLRDGLVNDGGRAKP